MRVQGEVRVSYVCVGCGSEILETWQEARGGYWLFAPHDTRDCNTALLAKIKALELALEKLTKRFEEVAEDVRTDCVRISE